jgi:uncharacterized protein YabN with tetrapyrrole methylase and pyrophosphatase domain
MKEDFQELFEFCKKNRKLCPWTKQFTSEQFVKEFLSEANEVKEALDNKNYNNLEEELGDALVDLLTLSVIAEEEGKIKTDNIIKGILNKMKERKPHIFEGKQVSLKEAMDKFYKVKEEQKRRKSK